MWHSLCAVILMSSVTLAESERLAGQSNTDPPTTKPAPAQTKPPGYRQYTYYTEIRQGTTERAAVALAIGAFVTSPRPAVPGIVPLKLELQGAEGITVKNVDYPKPRQQKFAFRPEPIPVAFANNRPIQFKVRADRTAPLGLHTLSGKLTFQVVTNKGVSEPQSIDVQVRLTVVAHNAKVHRAAWPYHEMSHAQLVTLIVLSPVLVALFIPAIALCAIMTGSPLGCE